MAFEIRDEHPLEAFSNIQQRGERLLFISSSCKIDPLHGVKFFRGRGEEVESIFPNVTIDIIGNRPEGPIFYLVMGKMYSTLGALQCTMNYPITFIDPVIFIPGFNIVTVTLADWARTHIYCPKIMGSGVPMQQVLDYLKPISPDITIWTGDCSI